MTQSSRLHCSVPPRKTKGAIPRRSRIQRSPSLHPRLHDRLEGHSQTHSGHRLFISAFMIASKVICNDTYSNKSGCIVGQNLLSSSPRGNIPVIPRPSSPRELGTPPSSQEPISLSNSTASDPSGANIFIKFNCFGPIRSQYLYQIQILPTIRSQYLYQIPPPTSQP
jgi:hypothetical protein